MGSSQLRFGVATGRDGRTSHDGRLKQVSPAQRVVEAVDVHLRLFRLDLVVRRLPRVGEVEQVRVRRLRPGRSAVAMKIGRAHV